MGGAGVSALRFPTEEPQTEQRYSYSSPSGRTSSRRSRTGRAVRQRGQNSAEAWNSSNSPGGTGPGLMPLSYRPGPVGVKPDLDGP